MNMNEIDARHSKIHGNGDGNPELKRPNRAPQGKKPDRSIPVSDASKGLTVTIREVASRHSQELKAIQASKQVLVDRISDAYVSQVENMDAEIAAAVAEKLQGVQQSPFPFGVFLDDWEAPLDTLSGYQPKYLPSASSV